MEGRPSLQLCIYVIVWTSVLFALHHFHIAGSLELPLALTAGGVLLGWMVIIILETYIQPTADRMWNKQLIRFTFYVLMGLGVLVTLLQPHTRPQVFFFSWFTLMGSKRYKGLSNNTQGVVLLAFVTLDGIVCYWWSQIPHWPVAIVLAMAFTGMCFDNFELIKRQRLSQEPSEPTAKLEN